MLSRQQSWQQRIRTTEKTSARGAGERRRIPRGNIGAPVRRSALVGVRKTEKAPETKTFREEKEEASAAERAKQLEHKNKKLAEKMNKAQVA